MGADITFHTKENEFYFRDAYNLCNLAWVIGKSYWTLNKKGKKRYIEFFNELANITDKQIKERVKHLFTEKRDQIADKDTGREWITMFKRKRNDIKKNLKIINNATRIEWSV